MGPPIESVIQWHDLQISTSEGISTSSDFHHPFQIEGARWHLLRTLAGPRLGTDLVPFISSEAQLQRDIDATCKIHCIAWVVLSAARDLYIDTQYLGGTAVTAPPFFDTAARSDTLFWHPDPTRISGFPVDSPLVMALADFTDNDFKENYAPLLQQAGLGYSHPSSAQRCQEKSFPRAIWPQDSDRTRQGLQGARVVDVWP